MVAIVLITSALSLLPSSVIENDAILASFGESGLESIKLKSTGFVVNLSNDTWSASINSAVLDQSMCKLANDMTTDFHRTDALPTAVSFSWICDNANKVKEIKVSATYSLRTKTAEFVSKVLNFTSTQKQDLAIASVAPFAGLGITAKTGTSPTLTVSNNPFARGLSIAGFIRFGGPGSNGLFLSVANPWPTFTATSGGGGYPCAQGFNHKNDDLERIVKGVQDATGCMHACEANSKCVGFVWNKQGCESTPAPGYCFLKSSVTPAIQEGCSCLGKKPFVPPSPGASQITVKVEYNSGSYTHTSAHPTPGYETEAAVLGFTTLGAYSVAPSGNGINRGERKAFVNCVETFLLDSPSRANKTVKVNVAWDENDYQIDVGTDAGVTEYKRIIDRNAQFGVTHIVYEPQNTKHSNRHNSTDGWGWEGSLWLSMGELLREGRWTPGKDKTPQDILDMVAYADTKGVKLMAYAYPCLHFQAMQKHWIGGALDISPPEVTQWWKDTMHAFVDSTGIGGFAWDHNIFAGPSSLQYAQWRAWMSILASLRASYPEFVMDHRQTAHIWGPWYHLAGSYSEPIAGDENPETYGVPIANMHTDHVAADNTRRVNYIYAVDQLLPASRVPGFIFHQTERTDDNGTNACFGREKLCYDMNIRDFDLLGMKYSVISTIGTAGQNLVVTMIPARDPAEFKLFPAPAARFITDWLQWTDDNLRYLVNTFPISTLPAPGYRAVDGTCAMLDDEGYVFLFNPNMPAYTVNLTVDESMDISNASRSAKWAVTELYPGKGSVGTWSHGQTYSVAIRSSDARVLKLTKLADTADALAAQRSVRQKCDKFAQAVGGGGIPKTPPVGGHAVPANFAGGWYNSTFTVPQSYFDQLAARAKAYPIQWTAQDARATWLAPNRLLMVPFFEHPSDNGMGLQLYLDGASVPLSRSYNSRGLVRPRCFLGYYVDCSNLVKAGAQHTFSLKVPANVAGSFQGLFWENIEAIDGDSATLGGEGCRSQ